MRNQPPILLLALAAAFTGCSVKVDLADESTTTAEAPPSVTSEKSRTAIEVGFLVDQESEPEPAPPTASEKSNTVEPAHEPALSPATPEPPSRGAEDRTSVTVVNIYDFDIQRHDHTHYHLHEARPRKKPVKVRIELAQKDERCERLMKEHLKRVARWEAMFQR